MPARLQLVVARPTYTASRAEAMNKYRVLIIELWRVVMVSGSS